MTIINLPVFGIEIDLQELLMGTGCSSENSADSSATKSNAPESHAAGGGKANAKKGKVTNRLPYTIFLPHRIWTELNIK